MTNDELEQIRRRVAAAQRQWLPAGSSRILALQVVVGTPPAAIVVGVEPAFSELILTMREDLEALLAAIDDGPSTCG